MVIIDTKSCFIRSYRYRYVNFSFSFVKYGIKKTFILDPDRDSLTVLSQAQEMLRREHSIGRTTIQVEPYDESVMNSCENCRRPIT